jgi:ribosomal protein S18 acetylase RimI-like enzyme
MKRNDLVILDWDPKYRTSFSELNLGWLNHYFRIEPIDEFVLFNPEEAILLNGGTILLAELNGEIIGTAALRKQSPEIFELTKMTIREDHRGKGFGEQLCLAVISKAREMNIRKLVLYSSTRLPEAIPLYHKLGFRQIEKEEGAYARCDIKMELVIDSVMVLPGRILHARLISQIGRKSFADTFAKYFVVQADLDNYLDYTFDPSRIAASIAKPNNSYFLAYLNGHAIGFIKLKKRSGNKLWYEESQTELQKIYLLAAYHRTGAADELMKACFTTAESVKSSLIWLDVIIENERAIRFYQKYGFSRAGHHEFRIGSQVFLYHIMVKQMAPGKLRRTFTSEMQHE